MEQKRILWVVVAIGIFLLIVIGAALILYSPKDVIDNNLAFLDAKGKAWVQTGTELGNLEIPNGQPLQAENNANEIILNQGTQGTQTLDASTIKTDNLTVFATNTNLYSQNQQGQTPVAVDSNAGKTVINLTIKDNSVAENTNAAEKDANATNTQAVAKSTEKTADKTADKAATAKPATSTTTTKPATSAKTVAKTEPKKAEKLADQWWVQVTSPTNKQIAENVRAKLSEQKINSEVFTYSDAKNVLHYRVRVGPYTTEGEAAYWCKIIKEIGDFSDAYISNSSAKKN